MRKRTGTKGTRKTGTSCVIEFIAYFDANYRVDKTKNGLKTTNTRERATDCSFSLLVSLTFARLEQPRRFVRWKTSDSWSSTVTSTVIVHDEEQRTNAGRRKIATIRIAVVRLVNLRSARFAQTAERKRFLSLSLSACVSGLAVDSAGGEKERERERKERDREKETRERKTRRLSIRIERGAARFSIDRSAGYAPSLTYAKLDPVTVDRTNFAPKAFRGRNG